MNNQQIIKISGRLYEDTIKRGFNALANDLEPDAEAVREVQKAMSLFVRNILTQAYERSVERDKSGDKLYAEDLLYVFKDNQKYLDASAKSMFNFPSLKEASRHSKQANRETTNQKEDDLSSEAIERLHDSQPE